MAKTLITIRIDNSTLEVVDGLAKKYSQTRSNIIRTLLFAVIYRDVPKEKPFTPAELDLIPTATTYEEMGFNTEVYNISKMVVPVESGVLATTPLPPDPAPRGRIKKNKDGSISFVRE